MIHIKLDYTLASRELRSRAGRAVIYNDRLRSGARSYKVRGWGLPRYQKAKRALESLGYIVKIVETGPITFWGMVQSDVNRTKTRRQYRLHVE